MNTFEITVLISEKNTIEDLFVLHCFKRRLTAGQGKLIMGGNVRGDVLVIL
jgi:hypothetical protein